MPRMLRVEFYVDVSREGEVRVRENQCLELDGGPSFSAACPVRGFEDYQGFMALPSLCSAHSHLLDYAFPEAGEEKTIEELVALPGGLKYRLLAKTPRRVLLERLSLLPRLLGEKGVGIVYSYAELGDEGVSILRRVFSGTGIVVEPYPQPLRPGLRDYALLLEKYGRVGLDVATSFEDWELEELRRTARRVDGIIQVHVSETPSLYRARDYEKAVVLGRAGVAVHATFLAGDELEEIATRMRGLVLCPTSNRYHVGVGPRVEEVYERLWRKGYRSLAFGTDNAAWGEPSVLGEAREAYLLARQHLLGDVDGLAEMLVYMATVGCENVGPAERSRGSVVLVELPEAKWSERPLVTLVKRGAYRRKITLREG